MALPLTLTAATGTHSSASVRARCCLALAPLAFRADPGCLVVTRPTTCVGVGISPQDENAAIPRRGEDGGG